MCFWQGHEIKKFNEMAAGEYCCYIFKSARCSFTVHWSKSSKEAAKKKRNEWMVYLLQWGWNLFILQGRCFLSSNLPTQSWGDCGYCDLSVSILQAVNLVHVILKPRSCRPLTLQIWCPRLSRDVLGGILHGWYPLVNTILTKCFDVSRFLRTKHRSHVNKGNSKTQFRLLIQRLYKWKTWEATSPPGTWGFNLSSPRNRSSMCYWDSRPPLHRW